MMYEYRAVVVSEYDGDTIRADIDLGRDIWVRNEPLRLLGIDAPEIGKPGGIEARDYLRSQLPIGATITIRTVKDKTEKYGRLLATIWDNDHGDVWGDSVNQRMVWAGHAVPYDGGKR
jgi:micrococcal nuclease